MVGLLWLLDALVDATPGALPVRGLHERPVNGLPQSARHDQRWREARRDGEREHFAITHPGGSLLFGLHGRPRLLRR